MEPRRAAQCPVLQSFILWWHCRSFEPPGYRVYRLGGGGHRPHMLFSSRGPKLMMFRHCFQHSPQPSIAFAATCPWTSRARGDTICPVPLLPMGAQAPRAPPSRRNVAVLTHAEYVPTLTAAAALRVKAALCKADWWPWPLTFWLKSGVWVTCDVCNQCANFGLPSHLCSRVIPDVRDRQTDRRQTSDKSID